MFATHSLAQLRTWVFWACAVALLAPHEAVAKDPIYTGFFSNKAISGYDTVAYFTEGKPRKGSRKFQTLYLDATWLFASQEHLDLFVANPEKYAPQYGGYCAWAVAQGSTASADPTKWKVVDGKLYLNYDQKIQSKWEANIPDFIRQGNANWPGVIQ